MTKEEKKDELKNRISMAKEELKQEAEEKCVCTDEAMRIMYGIGYIDGAEPREKRIAELKQENKDLADCNSRLLSQVAAATKRVVALEKENAEPKEKLKPENCLKLLAKEGYIKFTSEQLNKAKEIIKGLLSCCRNYPQENAEKIKQAEQFIKEIAK